ncbi:MAG: rhodanese-like domain-containing protein [Parvularculaceae bacterium]
MKKLLLTCAAIFISGTMPALAQDSFGGNAQQPPQQQDQWGGQQPPPASDDGQYGGPNNGQYGGPNNNAPNNGNWSQQPDPNNGGNWGQQPNPNNGGWGQQPPPVQNPGPNGGGGANLDQLMQMERQDYGVPATKQLHNGAMHGPTPASIPGGQLITTKGLASLVQGKQAPFMLFDVLGGPQTLPGAIPAVVLAQPGSFNDQVSQQFGQNLQQATGGRKDTALVFYCLSTQCWMSYNAALRAINLGYTNVLWYRGGLEAWQQAGLPVQQAQQFGPPPQRAPQQPQQNGWPNQ